VGIFLKDGLMIDAAKMGTLEQSTWTSYNRVLQE
jgi:hypothetical protein